MEVINRGKQANTKSLLTIENIMNIKDKKTVPNAIGQSRILDDDDS